MNDILVEVLKVIRQLWKRRWLIWIVATLVCSVGWAMVYSMPNKYESMARVFINTQSMLKPLLVGLAINEGRDEKRDLAESTKRTLLSRPNLEKVIRATDMDHGVNSQRDTDDLILRLSEEITVSGKGKDNIYVISYEGTDPRRAQKVVETLLAIFVENTLGISRKDTSVAERFIEEQIQEYEARLVAGEERLKEFKQQNMGLMPGDAGGYYSKMEAETAKLEQAKLELKEALNKRDQLAAQIEQETLESQKRAAVTSNSDAFDDRINGLEARLDELLLQYTDRHPDVVSIKTTIDELYRRKQQRLGDIDNQKETSAGAGGGLIATELKIAHGAMIAEVSALQVRVAEYEKRAARLRSMMETIPKVEAEFSRLNRGYEINQKNYRALVDRRESAKISRDADQSVDEIQFKIIDPPLAAVSPSGPKRPLFYTLVLLGGIALGAGIAWLLAMIKPVFYNPKELRELYGLPVYGSVGLISDSSMVFRRRINAISFLLAGGVLIAAYVGLIAVSVMRG